MRILLAIDESSASMAAIREVRKRAWPSSTVVRVLHVVEKFVPPAAQLWYDAGGSLIRSKDEVLRHYEEIADQVAEDLRARGLETETVVCEGNPHKDIVENAFEWRADLIVVGSHCYTAVRRFFLGSVAQSVVNRARCPIEIVPERCKQEIGG